MMNLHDLYDAAMSVSSKQKAESTIKVRWTEKEEKGAEK
jgi:hypothetical protein